MADLHLVETEPRNRTRAVRVGSVTIGGGTPVAVQSMAATRTQDIEATVRQVQLLEAAGADLVRIAVDSKKDVEALAEVRARTSAVLSVDLQENYRLAEIVAPYVDKIRYNPGHLYHHEREKSARDKVAFLAEIAEQHDCALRVGVNCGSVDPVMTAEYGDDDVGAMVASALEHCAILDDLGFTRYVVSMKDSDWKKVVEGNRRFAEARPDVPLHLGVTEAGMPPEGIIKTRVAFEQLIPQGIGDTIRVSLTLPFEQKGEEIAAGRQILADIAAGRFRSVPPRFDEGLNIISCPSCSRVENEAFIELAQQVKQMSAYAKDYAITIAVMGCRVNGPGETDDADLGLWCGPAAVNLKRGEESLGAYPYDEVLGRLRVELDALIRGAHREVTTLDTLPPLALSTMWAMQPRFQHDLHAFLECAQALGYTAVEINHSMDAQMVGAILASGVLPVTSVHAPAPLERHPTAGWNRELNLAATDESERAFAVQFTTRSIDVAAEAGARFVVVHLGGVEKRLLRGERRLRELWPRRELVPEEWERTIDEAVRERAGLVVPYLREARRSLDTLVEYAQARGVAVGLECRLHYHEIPLPQETADLLRDYPASAAGYGHDVGHAEVQHRLGLIERSAWFDLLGDRLLGTHLHDVRALTDHRAPGGGDVDFRWLASRVPAEAARTFEIDQREPDEAVAGAIEVLRTAGLAG